MAITGGQVLKYTLLPGILPRIYRLLTTGFASVPYFIAVIYQAVGLLPRNHPYLDPRNTGRFGVRHVIAEAANNLVFDRRHIDQILVFTVILAGIVLLALQIVIAVVALFTYQAALALPSFTDLLMQPPAYNSGPRNDMAFMVLDQVFGVRNIFNSCVSTAAPDCFDLKGSPITIYDTAYPTPFHLGLHALLRFYSLGIFNIAVFVVIYFVITITAETAETGSPFGQRLNRAWAPVRLILAFALLVPLNTGGSQQGGGAGTNAGFNGAQIITFWVAKFGSNFATNAWGFFNVTMASQYLIQAESLVGKPQTPEVNDLVKFIFIAKTCKMLEEIYVNNGRPGRIQAYLVRENQKPGASVLPAWPDAIDFLATDYALAQQFTNYGQIMVRFGELNDDPVNEDFKSEMGHVKSYCGDLRIPVTDLDEATADASGTNMIQSVYYRIVQDLWRDQDITTYAQCLIQSHGIEFQSPVCTNNPNITFMQTIVQRYQNAIDSRLDAALDAQVTNGDWEISTRLRERGWAGAAIWYNRLAELNGDIAAAVFSLPEPAQYPYVMEKVAEARRDNNANTDPDKIFDPRVASGVDIIYTRDFERRIATTLNEAYGLWMANNAGAPTGAQAGVNPMKDMVNAIFGTSGLFSMRRNTDIHPLAQLTQLGKGMMYACLRNYAGGAGLTVLGNFLSKMSGAIPIAGTISAAITAQGAIMSNVAKATMAMAFVLAYVLPFMPFIYFFFALGSWIKAIFEAIVAMPLWALAHIRIDGEGMAGPGATQGYFLLLEIFLRPILILMGLLASIQVFAALVSVLNEIFDLVVNNATGFDSAGETSGIVPSKLDYIRSPIDEFFFTVLYVILCYMMGTGCFKLIDAIPNSILRWFGVSTPAFTSQAGDSGGQVLEKTYQIASLSTQQVSGGQLATLLGGPKPAP